MHDTKVNQKEIALDSELSIVRKMSKNLLIQLKNSIPRVKIHIFEG